jgi:outer membrane protein assembly factor BamB
MTHLAFCKVFLAVVLLAAGQTISAADWPQFLGPNRNGISSESGLIDGWPDGGVKEVWRAEGGVGMSGLAIQSGRVVTLVQRDGQQWLISLASKTGQPQWKTALAPDYEDRQGDGPRATPTIVGEVVFAFTGEGMLAAANVADGKIRWSQNVVKQLGGKVADYGMASSPLVVADLVIVTAGAPKACVAAYRAATGELAWTAGEDATGYSSPALLRVGGRLQLVVFTGSSALGIEPKDGTVLWRYPYETDYDCNIATPVAVDGDVLISSGENHGSVLLKLVPAGQKFDVLEVWKSEGPRSALRSEWQTPIVLDGKVYGLDNIGSAGPVTHLTCLDAATGKPLWQQARFGKSNLIAADGKLIFSTMTGELIVARADPARYEEIGRQTILGPTRQAPALADGLIYLRDDKHIVCLDLRRATP